jgi:hypothetical protein
MCVVSRELLSAMNTGETAALTAVFDDGSEDTVKISIKDTTNAAYNQIFTDVGTDSTAWEYIHPLVRQGIIPANGGSQYGPDETVTYAEFCAMLKNTGATVGDVPTPSAVIPAVEAEKLLFNALTSEPFKAGYQALNKLNLWQPYSRVDLTSDCFAFFDMVLPHPMNRAYGYKPDGSITFTRAQAAEAICRFTKLIDYGKALDSVQQPMVSPSSSEIFVDGKPVQFDIFAIGGSNYLKLRDLAFTLNGTVKQFSVDYDAKYGDISLTANKPYSPVGGEMSAKGSQPRQASMSRVSISVDTDGYVRWYTPTAYTIGGNNYFKLRDLGKILDFGVEYNETSKDVSIETDSKYSE